MKKETNTELLLSCLGLVFVILIMAFLTAAIGMWLWNAILVPMFAFPIIGYWQMYGIIVLVRLVFGSGSRLSSSSRS